MNLHPEPSSTEQVTLLLELRPEEGNEADLALVNAIGLDVIHALQNDGALVQSVNTGTATRGGELLVQIISTVTSVASEAWAHRDVFEHILNDASALVTICAGVVPLLRHLFRAHTQEAGQQQHAVPPTPPIKITLEIDGTPLRIEAHDVAQAEAVLKIAQRFYHNHPDVARKVSAHSKVKVKGSIASRPPRKRR